MFAKTAHEGRHGGFSVRPRNTQNTEFTARMSIKRAREGRQISSWLL